MFHWIRRWFRQTPPLHPLLAAARSVVPVTRQTAAEQLAEVTAPWATEELLRLLTDLHIPVRQAARLALDQHKSIVPVLLIGLQDSRVEVAVASAELLGRVATAETVAALVVALKYAGRPVQIAARKALGQSGAVAVPLLREALAESQPWVRQQLVAALAEAEQGGRTTATTPEVATDPTDGSHTQMESIETQRRSMTIRKGKPMQTFSLSNLVAESERSQQRWQEFLRVPTLSMGLYRLKAGQLDEQQPHTEDEVYFVITGKASFRAGEQEQAVAPGTLIFVERNVEHRFFDVTEDLTVLVFFAPPEGSLKDGVEK